MTPTCTPYQKSSAYGNLINRNRGDDIFTGTTFSKINRSYSHKKTFSVGDFSLHGSSIILIDFGNNNGFINIPIYTQFRMKDAQIAKPVFISNEDVSEPEEKEFSFKPFPVKSYKLKVKIASVHKGTHKFQSYNDYL
ncbi:MAG: hypothetical protein ABIJ97_08650 [Bacteroidota bacterium]